MQNILRQLAVVKNPILFFGLAGDYLLLQFGAKPLIEPARGHEVLGFIVVIAAIVLLFVVLGFYIYAFKQLPSSAQEVAFAASLEAQLAEDKNLRKKID